MPSIPNTKSETPGQIATRSCPKCGAEKPLTDFKKLKSNCNQCKDCLSKYNADYWNAMEDHYYLWYVARSRCRKNGREFNITPEDVKAVMTDTCPYLEIPIRRYPNVPCKGKRAMQRNDSISLDRIDSNKGYTPDNIIVCSWRANALLSNASSAEMALLTMNFQRILNSTQPNETTDALN